MSAALTSAVVRPPFRVKAEKTICAGPGQSSAESKLWRQESLTPIDSPAEMRANELYQNWMNLLPPHCRFIPKTKTTETVQARDPSAADLRLRETASL